MGNFILCFTVLLSLVGCLNFGPVDQPEKKENYSLTLDVKVTQDLKSETNTILNCQIKSEILNLFFSAIILLIIQSLLLVFP